MKRIFALCVILCFLVCACKEKEIAINVSGISFTLNVQRGTEEYEIFFKTENNLKTVYATVKNVNNMKYTIKNGVATIEFGDIKVSKNINDKANDDIVLWTYKALAECDKKVVQKSENNFKLSGSFFELFVAPSGYPLSIVSKDGCIKGDFSNLTLVKEQT